MGYLLTLLISGWVCLWAEISLAESPKAPPEDVTRDIKILITAQQVEFDPQKETAIYTGGVTVKQENTTLYADRIEVYLIEQGKNIKLIKAYGDIKVTQEEKIITAEEGIYYHQDRKVVLWGNPTTREGENFISGDKITYFWDQGKVLVEGNVRAIIAVDKEKLERVRPK